MTTYQRIFVEKYHYKAEDVMILTDDNPDQTQHPTRQNMINAMQWLIHDAKCHDSLFFHCESADLADIGVCMTYFW